MGCLGEVVWDFCFVLFFLFFMINIQFIKGAGNLSQLQPTNMGVYLSGFRTVMTKQLLYMSQTGSGLKQMGGIAMSQHMQN